MEKRAGLCAQRPGLSGARGEGGAGPGPLEVNLAEVSLGSPAVNSN